MRQILQRDLAARLLARDGCRVLGVVDFDVCCHVITPLSDKIDCSRLWRAFMEATAEAVGPELVYLIVLRAGNYPLR